MSIINPCKVGNKFHIRLLLEATREKELEDLGVTGAEEKLHITFGDYYDLMNHMAPKANAWWTEIPRFVCTRCAPKILKQHPFLAKVDVSKATGENCREWLALQIDTFGEYFEIRPNCV